MVTGTTEEYREEGVSHLAPGENTDLERKQSRGAGIASSVADTALVLRMSGCVVRRTALVMRLRVRAAHVRRASGQGL